MRGAEQLSRAILESGVHSIKHAACHGANLFKDPALVKKDHDLSAQMTARKEKLSWLIGFINNNGVLVKV